MLAYVHTLIYCTYTQRKRELTHADTQRTNTGRQWNTQVCICKHAQHAHSPDLKYERAEEKVLAYVQNKHI